MVDLAFLGLLQRVPDDQGEHARRSAPPVSLSRWLYDRVDRWRSSSYLEIFAADNLTGIPGAQAMHAVPVRFIDGAEQLTETAQQHLSSLRLDLILVLSDSLVPAAAARCARLGAAGFVLSDSADAGEAADGLPEVLSGEGLVGVRLELYAAGSTEPTQVIDTVTNADRYSAAVTRANAAWHCVPLLERLAYALRQRETGRSAAAMRARLDRVRRSHEVSSRGPLGAQLASLAFRYASSHLRRRPDVDQWEMAYQWGTPDAENRQPDLTISNFHALRPPADRFWADPFPLRVGDRHYVLFEELQFAEKRGYICAMELESSGPIGDPVIILDRPYHLSYPFVFEYGGEHYMLPETTLEGRLELYRAVRLPFEWTLDRVLIDAIHLIDATLAEIDDTWWLFGCRYIPGLREWNDLMLYHAPSPMGPWTSHPGNPVISDVRCARPAGKLYCLAGSWYRPAQDCARTYGGALTIRHIVRLNEREYEEEEVARVDPHGFAGIEGVHTLNRLGSLSVIDVKRQGKRRGSDRGRSRGGARG